MPQSERSVSAPSDGPPGMAARQAALDILNLIDKGATLDDALARCRSFEALSGPDRGFARALATTVLRRRGVIDDAIGTYIDRPLPKKSYKVMDILRLAAAQSIFMDGPDHAVVSTAVALAKNYRETAGYDKLVNAIARKIAKNGSELVDRAPLRSDTPGWLWRSWERSFGPAKTRAIARAHQLEAPVDLTPKDPAAAPALAEQLGGAVVLDYSVRLEKCPDVTALAGFEEGAFWVQDAAAALPARLLGDLSEKTVLDLCAAPGGKTMQLAATGAKVIAVDSSGPRLKRLQENLERVGLRAITVKSDVLELEHTPVDAILLDAPCSATGTVRRHPDLLWAKSQDDVSGLEALQAKMLERAFALLKPGGRLVYATCSLQAEEGEQQIRRFLEKEPTAQRVPITASEIGGLAEAITRDGDLRSLPSMLAGQGGMDGFFAARLTKS